jgi:Holliday junction DNA helicase RuvB
MNNLRPKKLSEIIGQCELRERLEISLASAKQRRDALPHILFDGPPGTGKTTLALAMANELGVDIQIANGANVRTVKKIIPYILRVAPHSILFIDEIHRLTKLVEEILYPVMEDYRLDLVDNSGTTSFNVPKFTLIGATTEGGSLSKPFYDRFHIHEHLQLYKDKELLEIIKINKEKLNIRLDLDAERLLARVSRGTPRVCNNLLQWIRDYALSKRASIITKHMVVEALKMKGIDHDGLNTIDIKYINCIRKAFNGGPVSLETLSNATSISRETIISQIEPFLVRKGKIAITKKGRVTVNEQG